MDLNIFVNGIPLVAVVIGLVAWVKSFGLTGGRLTASSMAIGVALGIGYQVSIAVPTSFGGWFQAVVFGLTLGLVASGIYDTARTAMTGAVRDAYNGDREEMKY